MRVSTITWQTWARNNAWEGRDMENRLKILAVFFCLGICVMSMQVNPVFAVKNEPDGFGGLKWGDSFTPDMEFRGMDGEFFVFVRPGDKMEFGSTKLTRAELTSIEYIFWYDKLIEVKLGFEGEGNHIRLFLSLEKIFGSRIFKGDIEEKGFSVDVWGGDKTIAILAYNCFMRKGILSLRSVEVGTQYKKAKEKEEIEKEERLEKLKDLLW